MPCLLKCVGSGGAGRYDHGTSIPQIFQRKHFFCPFWKECPSFLTASHPDLNLFRELQVPEKKQPWESKDNLGTRNVQEGHCRSPHRTWMGERGYPCENFQKILYIIGICGLLHLFWSSIGRKSNAGLFCLSP